MKIKKIFAISIIFLICTIAKAATDSDKWSGFRGLKWGVNIKDMNDPNMILIEKNEKEEGTVYRRTNDKLSIGRAELSSLNYCCYKDCFFGVMIVTKNKSNFQYLKDAVFAYYGEGHQKNEFIKDWTWASPYSNCDKDVVAGLKYNEFSEKGEFFISYMPIMNAMIANDAAKAKEAEKDF